MRVLFLERESMWIHGLPNGFKDAGHDVEISGPLTERIIKALVIRFNPDMIISIGWTAETTGEKVKWIKKYVKSSGIPYIYWASEDPTHTFSFTLPFVMETKPDFIFTICKDRVDFYKERGFRAAHMDFGFHKSIHHPTGPLDQYLCKIAVVANAYARILDLYPKHYRIKSIRTLIVPLLKENIRIDFWGWGWDKMYPFLGQEIPPEYIHGRLPYTETNKVYSSADIVLGLQNHETQLTQRTYEILASGGVMLTSDTSEVRMLFKPGLDLLVSSCVEETLAQIYYYLEHKEELEIIRNQAQIAVSEHSYKGRAEYMVNVLKEHQVI